MIKVTAKFDFPQEELKVIKFWREIDAFKTSIKLREGAPEFSFYDGPPFATGRPHYGHLLAGTVKVRPFFIDMTLVIRMILWIPVILLSILYRTL
jgi:hypothetical protein